MPNPSMTSGLRTRVQAMVTYDFAPRFSAKARRFIYNPLGVLTLAALTSLLCGLFLHSQGFVLCGGVLAVVALGVIWPWLTLRGLAGTVSFARVRATEGEAVEVRLTLRNRLPWPAWGLAVRNGFDGHSNEAVAGIAVAPRRRTAICLWSFKPLCRGVYPFVTPKLTTGFPFGLWVSRRTLTVEKPLVVWPSTFPVGPIPPVSGDHQVEGNVSRSKVGTNGDVLGVRPYRRGDSPRRIHWGQSARQDRLIVCELQSNSRPVIQIVLDADPRVHVGTGADSSREWSIRIVASFAKGWLEDGAQVGLAWGAHDIPPASGQSQLHKILDALAGLPDDTPRPLADVLTCPKCRGFRDGLQVIVTTDRTHAHDGCGACESEDQRWVVLKAGAFADKADIASCGHCPTPWLLIESAESVPALLKGGWREARHGS
ncbi:MAG: DUF58 domain-containing protein [Gemmataceae bacterium]